MIESRGSLGCGNSLEAQKRAEKELESDEESCSGYETGI
jgi:hypothetical protein